MYMRDEVFTAMKIHVVIFWVVTLCIHLQGEVKMKAARSS